MKRDVVLWQAAGFAAVSVMGTLLHFLYDWMGESVWMAPFSGVNESTWEHMKLLYFPLLLFSLVQSRFFRAYTHFWCVKLVGTATGLLLIPTLFYTYNGAIGKSPDWLNITLYFLSAAGTFLLETHLLRRGGPRCHHPRGACVLLGCIGVLFVVFTFVPPHLPLFRDPLTDTYGIHELKP